MKNYIPAKKPYTHQLAALAKMQGKEDFALLMEMRTGKTKVLLDDYGRLELQSALNLFVIAPGGVYRTWKAACADHLSTDLQKRALIHVWQSGSTKKVIAERSSFLNQRNSPRILLMNVEALSSVEEARKFAMAFLSQGPCMLAIDESTIIKNHSSKRTKFINSKLAPLAAYRRILSGLPTPLSPLDLYSQFEFLDWKILRQRSFYGFRNRYAIVRRVSFGGREVPLVVGFQNVEELSKLIEPHSFRTRLEECYDLPAKVYMTREVSLTAEQKRLYDEMKNFATAKLAEDTHVTATIVIAQIMRLHQILCGHTRDEDGKVHEIAENRTAELISLLEDYAGKAIIWCSYDINVKRVMQALDKAFGKGSAAGFWGGNVRDREDEEKNFLHVPSCRFMVATAAAGGRGRTWTVADLNVYYSSSPNLEHRSQSEERPQGIGKTKPVTYVDLIVPKTVEEKFLKVLRGKIDIASAIMGDGYREWLI